jgi:hypothetical protein
MLNLFGVFAKQYGSLSIVQKNQEQLLRIFVRTASSNLFESRKVDPQLALGALNGLSGFLHNFPTIGTIASVNIGYLSKFSLDDDSKKTIFSCILHVIDPPDDISRYDLPKCTFVSCVLIFYY